MFWRRILIRQTSLHRSFLLPPDLSTKYGNFRNYSGILTNITSCYGKKYNYQKLISDSVYFNVQKFHYSRGLLDGDANKFIKKEEKLISEDKNELQKITELFPEARVTLNELSSKTPDKIFEIHYKQNMSSPKGAKKKQKPQANGWTCTYALVWPEKIRFESTGLSKRSAAEKAATQALYYLYKIKRIDNKGNPIYDQTKINELRTMLKEKIKISISDKSMERIEKIWSDYDCGIRDIYEKTFKMAAQKIVAPPNVLTKDSTIDEDDDFAVAESSDDKYESIIDSPQIHPVYGRPVLPPTEAVVQRRDRILKQRFERYDEELTPLPIDQHAEQVTSTLGTHGACVLVGAAGCGKSTRVPATLLRASLGRANIIVAQPRRVAAISLAHRVASELGEQVGETVGYQVRLQAKLPRAPCGSILFCTSGILLNRLQANPGLLGCTHVLIDEAHERDINTDLTLLLLKRAINKTNLKLGVMSASLSVDVFTKYLDNCPVIEVPGRTYPVEISYLEDIQKEFNLRLPVTEENCQKEDGKPYVNCQEVVKVIQAIDRTQPEGAILVFLPGWAEIKLTKQILEQICPESTHIILPVHSRLSTTDQTKMFSKPLPGVRKIVLATNIAETSITVPDVVYVVDCGAHKENTTREGTGTASLECVWVSVAGATQRAGRAGRVRPGKCYRLYTKDKESKLPPHTTPEILRVPLEQTVLNCKTYAPEDKVESFLSELPQPPTQSAIQFAVNDLIELGALTTHEKLTRLGSILSSLNVHPRLGAALLHGAICGTLLSSANVLAHCQYNIDVFRDGAERREEIRELKRTYSETSDYASLYWVQEDFDRQLQESGWPGVGAWCDSKGVRKDRLQHVKALTNLHLEQLLKTGIFEPTIEPEELNRFSDIEELSTAILLSGADCLINSKRHVKTSGKLNTVTSLYTSKGERAHIGSESVNYKTSKQSKPCYYGYFGGFHSPLRRALVVYKTCSMPPHTALLFAASPLRRQTINEEETILSVPKHRLEVHIPTSNADHILKAREMLWSTLKYYTERDLKSLDYDENTRISRFKVRLVKALGRILVEGHREFVLGKKIDENDER